VVSHSERLARDRQRYGQNAVVTTSKTLLIPAPLGQYSEYQQGKGRAASSKCMQASEITSAVSHYAHWSMLREAFMLGGD